MLDGVHERPGRFSGVARAALPRRTAHRPLHVVDGTRVEEVVGRLRQDDPQAFAAKAASRAPPEIGDEDTADPDLSDGSDGRCRRSSRAAPTSRSRTAPPRR